MTQPVNIENFKFKVAPEERENVSDIKPIVEMRSVGCVSEDDIW